MAAVTRSLQKAAKPSKGTKSGPKLYIYKDRITTTPQTANPVKVKGGKIEKRPCGGAAVEKEEK
jgi:hypothetical protein